MKLKWESEVGSRRGKGNGRKWDVDVGSGRVRDVVRDIRWKVKRGELKEGEGIEKEREGEWKGK
jgi:hypothetical protein